MSKMNQLLNLLKGGNWEEGEALWMEILEGEIESIDPLKASAHELWRRGEKERLAELLNLTTETLSEKNPQLWLEALRLQAEYFPKERSILKDFPTAFKKAYADRPYIAKWVDHVLANERPSPLKLIQTLDKLIIFQEGTVVKHKSGWGIGKVTEISEDNMDIIVDLERKPNHRMDALAAVDCLTPLDKNNFEALLVYNQELLKKEAEKTPLELIHRVMRFAEKPLGARELKKFLSPEVIDEKEWSKWWNKTRKKLITDPYVENAQGAHGKFSLREKPRDWEDEIKEEFDEINDVEKVDKVLNYLKNSQNHSQLSYFVQHLTNLANKFLREKKNWHALEAYLTVQECLAKGNLEEPENLPAPQDIFAQDTIAIFENLHINALGQGAFDLFLEIVGDTWEDYVFDIFLKGSDLSRDILFRYLKRKKLLGKYLQEFFHRVVDQREPAPDALIWFAQQALHGKIKSNSDRLPDMIKMYSMILTTLTTLKFKRQVDTEKAAKIFTFNLCDKVVKALKKSEALEVYRNTKNTTWLPAKYKEVMERSIREKFPRLFSKKQPLYTTRTGLQKYEDDYNDLIHKRIPANSEAIGKALSFGDISENAELDAAREEQVQLMQKAQEMQNNLNEAEIIDFSRVSTERVEVGTIAKLRKESGEEVSYTILGPWDVNLEEGKISFMSPIAKELLHKRVGDKVKLPAGKYELLDIAKYQEEEMLT